MALATRCPNCHALFRVVADQLKLRGGLVRCGACRHVFDAIGSLTYVDDAPPAAGASTSVAKAKATGPLTLRISPEQLSELKPARTPGGERPRPLDDVNGPSHDAATGAAARDAEVHAEKPRPSIEEEIAESTVPTLLAPGADAIGRSTRPNETARDERRTTADDEEAERREREQRRQRRAERRAREELAARPVETDAPHEPALEAADPDFLRKGESAARTGFSVFFGGGSVLLLALLLAQLAVMFRTELATRWPPVRPGLVQLCEVFGCTVGWPARADLLAVVGTELQAIPGTDVLELTAVVRNRAGFKLALPAIEVTLTDTQNRALARKVFAPVDYLASSGEPSSRIDEGLAAGSDYTIRIAFEARGLSAVGFVVYPFYL
jgi:predicted Zn finger-like uncharacterized protein